MEKQSWSEMFVVEDEWKITTVEKPYYAYFGIFTS